MKRRVDTALGLGIFAVLMAGLFGLLAWRDALHLNRPATKPLPPTRVEAILTDPESRATLAPRGGRIEASGRLTILEAPSSPGRSEPLVEGEPGWAMSAKPFDRAPMEIRNGIRALFRVVPTPPDEVDDDNRVWVGGVEYGGGRLVLIDGCFRMNGPRGPILVFPPGTRLGLRDGWLMVGPPGLPPMMSARVGEEIFWEGGSSRNFGASAKAAIRRLCGPGEIESAQPWSENVQVAREDGVQATFRAREQGIGWDEAMRPIRECRAREARGALKEGEHCRVLPSPPQPPPAPPLPGRPAPPMPPPPPQPALR